MCRTGLEALLPAPAKYVNVHVHDSALEIVDIWQFVRMLVISKDCDDKHDIPNLRSSFTVS